MANGERTLFVTELLSRPQPASAFDALREAANRLIVEGGAHFPPVLAVGGRILHEVLDEIELSKNLKAQAKAAK